MSSWAAVIAEGEEADAEAEGVHEEGGIPGWSEDDDGWGELQGWENNDENELAPRDEPVMLTPRQRVSEESRVEQQWRSQGWVYTTWGFPTMGGP